MKILIIGDPHIRLDNIETAGKLMSLYRQYAFENNMPIVFLGDLYHTHAMIRSEVHQFWFDYFSDGSKFIKKPLVIIGNHDMANQVIDADSSESPIKTLPNIVYSDRPAVYSNLLPIPIAVIPYCHTKKQFESALLTINELNFNNSAKVLFCHQEFSGFTYETGIPTSEESADISPLNNFKLVLSGHIHKHQVSKNVHYVGAPYHQKKSDWQNPRHVAALNCKDLSIEYLELFQDEAPQVQKPTNVAFSQELNNKQQPNIFNNLDEIVDFVVKQRYDNEEERNKYRKLAGQYLSKSS